MKTRWIFILAIAALAHSALAQPRSWAHLQVQGMTRQTCTITITMGTTIIRAENIPAESDASQVARALVSEINSGRNGHMFHASTNGVDNSIISIIADGSPVTNTTPWLGRLIPDRSVSISPGSPGFSIRNTNINDTLVAVAIEGEQADVEEGEISVKINGKTFTLEFGSGTGSAIGRSAPAIVGHLSTLIDEDPGFRSSVLRNDTGQLMLFISSENMGGGVHLQNGPTNVEGLRFSRARQPFARDVLYAGEIRGRQR